MKQTGKLAFEASVTVANTGRPMAAVGFNIAAVDDDGARSTLSICLYPRIGCIPGRSAADTGTAAFIIHLGSVGYRKPSKRLRVIRC